MAVELGKGESAFNVQLDITLIRMEFAVKWNPSANSLIFNREYVRFAIKDIR